jgi:hypothetical protein
LTQHSVAQQRQIFGLIDRAGGIGFSGGASQQQAFEDAIMPELLDFAAMRDKIRQLALTLKGAQVMFGDRGFLLLTDKALLTACDQVRDEDLPALGVRLEDKETGSDACIYYVQLANHLRCCGEARRQGGADAREATVWMIVLARPIPALSFSL